MVGIGIVPKRGVCRRRQRKSRWQLYCTTSPSPFLHVPWLSVMFRLSWEHVQPHISCMPVHELSVPLTVKVDIPVKCVFAEEEEGGGEEEKRGVREGGRGKFLLPESYSTAYDILLGSRLQMELSSSKKEKEKHRRQGGKTLQIFLFKLLFNFVLMYAHILCK